MDQDLCTVKHLEDLSLAHDKLLIDGDRVICTSFENRCPKTHVKTISPRRVNIELLSRGLHLSDPHPFTPGSSLWKKLTKNVTKNKRGKCFFVGYDCATLRPAFAIKGERDEKQSPPGRPIFSDSINKEVDFVTANCSRVHHVIFHHGLSTPQSMATIKAMLHGDAVAVARRSGGCNRKRLRRLLSEIPCSLHDGSTPKVLSFIKPAPQTSHDTKLGTFPAIGVQRASDNKPHEACLPHLRPFIYRDSPEYGGFVYQVPLMTVLSYPAELYEMLTAFAWMHRKDKFNTTAMLFAVQLWVDINDDPRQKLEPYFQKKGQDAPILPKIPLAVFIVYFEHWLKVHELLRCTEYAHPFRIIHQMYLRDFFFHPEIFSVSRDTIDEAKVVELVRNVKSTEARWDPSTRVAIFPWHTIGTTMTPPVDMGEAGIPKPTLKALIGLPSIRILGFPSLHHQQRHTLSVVVDHPQMHVTLFSAEFTWVNMGLWISSDVTSECRINLVAPFETQGTVWSHEFCPARAELVAYTTSNPRGIRGGLLKHRLGVDGAARFQARSESKLKELIDRKFLTPHTANSLHVAEDGLLCICGKPVHKPCVASTVQDSLEDCFGKFFAEDFLPVADERIEWMKKLNCFTGSMIRKLRIGPDGLLRIPGMPLEPNDCLHD